VLLDKKFSNFCFKYKAREPWNKSNSILYVPNESQHLVYGATSLASFLFLNEIKVQYKLEFVKNVNEMSPSGNYRFLISIDNFLIQKFHLNRKGSIIS
jgi:hypothetical protein